MLLSVLCIGVTLTPRIAAAQAPSYTFTQIVGINDPFATSVYCVGMNNVGTVVASIGGDTQGVWRGGVGQPFTQIAPEPSKGGCPSINDSNQISYVSSLGLMRSDNPTPLATHADFPFFSGGRTYVPSIAANGSVLFQGGGYCVLNWDGIYVAPPLSYVYHPDSSSCGVLFQSGTTWAASMNDNLVVAFTAVSSADGTVGVYRSPSLTPLVPDGARPGVPPVVINNSGRVAFVGNVDGRFGVYSTSDGVKPFEQASADGFTALGFISINDFDAIAYEGPDAIYAGPDAVLDRVVGFGTQVSYLDPDTGIVTAASVIRARMGPESLNNEGQIVFEAYLDNGHVGIYVAQPNRPPVASNGSLTVTAGQSASGTLVATDLDGDSLTYSINGEATKGTASITDPSTGAFTYAANVGVSGTDTFTFGASDGHASDAATITVTIIQPCAANISPSVTVSKSVPKLDRKTQRYRQTVTLKNNDGAIAGPVSLVLDNLNATLFNASGVTACTVPSGSPYIEVNVGADAMFNSRERATVTLEFANPSGQQISWGARVLAGSGGR